jgi:hypothetical protein
MDRVRLAFALIYIIVDLVYVTYSRSVYDAVVQKIQGSPMTLSGTADYLAVLGAYICMALGWYFILTEIVKLWVKTSNLPPVLSGAFVGFIYGLATIGMFNLTTHAMFKNYDWKIVGRDMTWGIGWQTVLAAIYAVVISRAD